MNLSYKLVKSKHSGELVVASELAKGHKKNTRKATAASLALLTSLGVSFADITHNVEIKYTSGTLVKPISDGQKYTISSDSDNSNGRGYQYEITDGQIHNLTFSGSTVDTKLLAKDTYKTVTLNDFKKDGDLSITKNDGKFSVTKATKANDEGNQTIVFTVTNGDQTFIINEDESGNITSITKDDVTYTKDLDGKFSTTIIKDEESLIVTLDPKDYSLPVLPSIIFTEKEHIVTTENGERRAFKIKEAQEGIISLKDFLDGLKKQMLVEELPVPYFDFTAASVTNGTLSLSDKINWDFGQIKQSHIFKATANGDQSAKIIADKNADITMIFQPGVVATTKDLYIDTKESVVGYTYQGKFQNAELARIFREELGITVNEFNVEDEKTLQQYQGNLLTLLEQNLLSQKAYDEYYELAFKPTDDSYSIDLKYGQKIDHSYLDDLVDLFGASVGINSIFKADGKNASVDLQQGSQLKAYYGPIVYGVNGAQITNNTVIALGDKTAHGKKMGNIKLESGAKYINNGIVIYGYQSTDGSWTSSTKGNTSYTDTVSNSTYDNNNEIFVGRYDQAIALSGKNAKFQNHTTGKMYLGAMDMTSGRSNGVAISQNGTWINDGEITFGKIKNEDGTLSNSKIIYEDPIAAESDYAISDVNNIISAITSVDSIVSIINNGTISIGDNLSDLNNYVQNTAAINIQHSGDSTSTVTVNNAGTINLGGYHSVGMRIDGKAGVGNTINNTGTINVSGSDNTAIYALNGAVINHSGIINVEGAGSSLSDNFVKRNYAIKSENGSIVNIQGADTQINLNTDNAIGVYARQGGKINISGVQINPDATKQNLVFYWISGRTAEGEKNSSQIIFNGANGKNLNEVNLVLNNANSTLFRVDQEAVFNTQAEDSVKYKFDVNGANSKGLYVAGKGTEAIITENTTFTVAGENATGIYVAGGAGQNSKARKGKVTLQADAKISVTGEGATAAIVDGNNYDINGNFLSKSTATLESSATLDSKNISYNGTKDKAGAIGYKLINSGRLDHKGSINFISENNDIANTDIVGIYVKGGTLNNIGGVTVNGIGIDIHKADNGHSNIIDNSGTITALNGIAAVRINKGASFTAKGSTNSLISGNRSADAIRVHDGATLTTNKAQIAVDGSGAGIHFMNTDAPDAQGKLPTFTLKGTGNITVQGDKATGILVQGENGKEATANFDSTGSKLQIAVKDDGGNGITTNTSGYVYSGSDVTIESLKGGSALVVKGKTNDIKQSGNLISSSDTAVVDLTGLDTSAGTTSFLNTGKIESKHKDGTAVLANSGENINFVNQGTIIGKLDLWTNSENTISITNNTNARISGDLIIGEKSDSHNDVRTNIVKLFGGSQAENIVAESGDTTVTLKDVIETEETRAADGKYVFKTLSANGGMKDTIVLDNSIYVLNSVLAKGISGFEALKIGAGSVFELYKTDLTLNEAIDNKDSGIFLTDKTSVLKVTNDQDFNLNHKLIGNGRVEANLSGQNLSLNDKFADFNSKNFTGTLSLTNTLYNLSGSNTTNLTKATLEAGKGSIITVAEGNGDQKIGGLKFDGGRVDFKDPLSNLQLSANIGDRANSLIQVDTLDVTNASGVVSVVLEDMHALPKNNVIPVHKPIIEHDQGESLIHIVHAEKINGISSGDLKLEMFYKDVDNSKNQGSIEGGKPQYTNEYRIIQDIQQGADGIVAKAIYDYGLESKQGLNDSERGLHITYKLQELDLLKDKSFILTSAAGKTGADADLSAKLTGEGHLVINTESDTISLSNGGNTYSGTTTVEKGHFYLENDGVLGNTSELILEKGTQTSVLGKEGNTVGTSQIVGALTSKHGSTLNLGSTGGLTIKGDKESNIVGSLTGLEGSTLTFKDGKATVHNANQKLNSNVQLDGKSEVQIYDVLALGGQLGAVTVTENAELKIGNSNPNSIEFSKKLDGAGNLTITTGLNKGNQTDSIVSLSGDNSTFTGDITVGAENDQRNTTLVVNKHSLGNGDNVAVNAKGTLVLDHSAAENWGVEKSITGNGQLNKIGSGVIELSQDASNYTGKTTVSAGQLVAGKTGNNDYVLNSKEVEIKAGASFLAASGTIKGVVNNHGQFIGSNGFVDNSLYNFGEFVVGNVDKDTKDSISVYIVNGNFTNHNNGVIRLNNKHEVGSENGVTNPGNIGNKLHIKGNYIANGGSIILNTVLNEGFEKTITDSIHVAGNVVKQGAATKLYIQNYGGLGAFTQVDAIKVISVDGRSDNGAFALGAPATIGVYEYTLHKGQNDNNWYLYSNPDYPVYGQPNQRNINPLVGGYLANMATSFEMFNMTLHDRLGNPSYGQSVLTGDDRGISAWGRIATVHRKYRSAQDGLSISGDFYLAQVGADLIKVNAENDGSYRFGVMAGYGSSDFTSRSRSTGSEAKGKIDQAMNIGIYGTWYQPESWFVDTWLQYSHFKNEVSMKQGTSNKYNSNLWSASIEVGYNHKTDEFDNGDYLIIQPNAQIIYGRLATKAFKDETSALFAKKNTKNNIQTRLGMKLFYVKANENNEGFKPYVEANWIHNSSSSKVIFNDRFKFSSNAPNDIFEVKIGAEGNLSEDWSVWGNVGYQFGKHKYKGYKATLGVKYTW